MGIVITAFRVLCKGHCRSLMRSRVGHLTTRVSGEPGTHCLVSSGTWTLWEWYALSFGRESADSIRGMGVGRGVTSLAWIFCRKGLEEELPLDLRHGQRGSTDSSPLPTRIQLREVWALVSLFEW